LKKIAWNTRCYMIIAIFCAVAFVLSLTMQLPNWNKCTVVLLAAGLIATVIFFIMNRRLKEAQLIVENQILHIQFAVQSAWDTTKENEFQSCEKVEVFVSYFGILLGSKVIKFNQDGIRLKAVEIGRDYISLDYGRDSDTQNIRLIHLRPDSAILEGIIEKFRYETGITPTITN